MQTHDKKMPDYNQVAQNDESAQFGFPEDWDSVQLDHLGNMSTFVWQLFGRKFKLDTDTWRRFGPIRYDGITE